MSEAKTTLLVTDDDPQIRFATARQLRAEGYTVLEEETGEGCLRTARQRHPDLILLDVVLPDVEGPDVCRRLKQDPRTEDIPIVLVSGTRVTSSDQAVGLERLADGYITRPYDKTEFLARVRAMLRIRAAEQALRDQRERLRLILAHIGDAVVATDEAGRVSFVNRSARSLLGLDAGTLEAAGGVGAASEPLVGRPVTEVLRIRRGGDGHAEETDVGILGELLRRPGSTEASEVHAASLLLPTGDTRPVSLVVTPLDMSPGRRATDRFGGFVIVLRDMSAFLEAQKGLIERSRQEVARSITAGLAHNINNLMTVVIGNADHLADSIGNDPGLYRWIRDILTSAHRASDLASEMMMYTQSAIVRPVPLCLNDTVRDTLTTDLVPRGLHVELDLDQDLEDTHLDPSQASTVVYNLIRNAVEAVGDASPQRRSRIVVSTRNIRFDRPDPTPGAEFSHVDVIPPGGYVLLAVEDNGTGMEEETRPRIFEPFYTTRFQGRGMGLAVVLGIARNYGGIIRVRSAPERGTTVRIYLPTERSG